MTSARRYRSARAAWSCVPTSVGRVGAGERETTMERRNFLIGMGSTAAGASALIGSGAFSRIESQRQVSIEVASDPNAYLGLDKCRESGSGLDDSNGASANGSYVTDDGAGHLEIDMSPSNETEYGGQGVNSDSHSWFNDVFQITNQGKDDVGISIDTSGAGIGEVDDGYDDEGEDRVQFYTGDGSGHVGDDLDRVDDGGTHDLGVGDSICVGILVISKGLEDGDDVADGEVVITADVDDYSG